MGVKVLVVEDSPTMRQLISFALKRLRGSQIVEACDGADGLKKMQQDKFDLIITDINMPIMDGLKLVTLVRQNPAHREVPIVIITTEGAQGDKDKAIALGANAYITKPIQASKVLQTVESLLKNSCMKK